MLEAQNPFDESYSGAVAAVNNGRGLVCPPSMHYRTFVCTTELKRRAANYSETLPYLTEAIEVGSTDIFLAVRIPADEMVPITPLPEDKRVPVKVISPL